MKMPSLISSHEQNAILMEMTCPVEKVADATTTSFIEKNEQNVEMPGFEPGASYMRSKRSTAELHPQGGKR